VSGGEGGPADHRRPPKDRQWKKGQCGNPARRYPRKARGVRALIDELFAKPCKILQNGKTRYVVGLEAILLQLSAKELIGDARARAVLFQYQRFAHRNMPPGKITIESDIQPKASDQGGGRIDKDEQ
jgi:hypothetical protein